MPRHKSSHNEGAYVRTSREHYSERAPAEPEFRAPAERPDNAPRTAKEWQQAIDEWRRNDPELQVMRSERARHQLFLGLNPANERS